MKRPKTFNVVGKYSRAKVADIRDAIEEDFRRFGAESFGVATRAAEVQIVARFVAPSQRTIRLTVPLPDPSDERFERGGASLEKATRERWCALKLSVRAKLNEIAVGLSSFDSVWAPDLVADDGRTAREAIVTAITSNGGKVPTLAPSVTSTARKLPVYTATEVIGDEDEPTRPVTVDLVTKPDQSFGCRPFGIVIKGRDCIERQKQSRLAMAAHGRSSRCYSCTEGKALEKRVMTPERRSA